MKENNKSEAFTVSLRDHFAMQAINGLLSTPNLGMDIIRGSTGGFSGIGELSELAYAVADSMLQERGKSSSSRYGKKK